MTGAGTLYIVAAPSGAGKTSLVKALLESTPGIEVSVSYTTRPPRPNERNGIDYHFVDHAAFRQLIERGSLLEHAQVFGQYYGTSRVLVLDRLRTGIDLILEIDWQGARQVRALLPDSISIFILPPSRASLLERLKHRGQDDDDVIQRRMRGAVEEMSHHAEFNYLIVNDEFATAVEALRAIIIAQRQRSSLQIARHRGLIHSLLS
ncbi:MAG: guanylate kinase [Gammaproteobacteria bacterium]